MRRVAIGAVAAMTLATPASADEPPAEDRPLDDGAYGRLRGDGSFAIEAGTSLTLGPKAYAGESLALRGAIFYVRTVGLVAHYDESFDLEAQPTRRSFAGALEVRPLFLGRFARDMERGPPWMDLTLDSLGISMGVWGAMPQRRFCPPRNCPSDYGMQAGLGIDLPLWADADSMYVAFDANLRWALSGPRDLPPPAVMLTLTLGYQHGFSFGLVDAGDGLEP